MALNQIPKALRSSGGRLVAGYVQFVKRVV